MCSGSTLAQNNYRVDARHNSLVSAPATHGARLVDDRTSSAGTGSTCLQRVRYHIDDVDSARVHYNIYRFAAVRCANVVRHRNRYTPYDTAAAVVVVPYAARLRGSPGRFSRPLCKTNRYVSRRDERLPLLFVGTTWNG